MYLFCCICIHVSVEFAQGFSGNLFVAVADNGICPCVNKEDAAGLLQLDILHDV